jgi:ATP-binding cassette subfamily F protein 3
VLELNEATIEAGGRTLLEVEQLWLERGERLSIVGANGSGKTTLIETLAGRRPLANGSLRVGHNVEIGYLSQHADEIGNGDRSVLAAACAATGLSEARARSLLGRFLFSGSEAQLSVANLSGGERRRLSLAIVVAAGANALILDEPTNHLDVESREALEAALAGFGGAIILVSHDRALLEALGGRTVVIEDGALRSYPGGWAEYVEARKAATTSARKRKEPAGDRRRVARTLDSDPDAVLAAIEQAEAELATLEDELSAPDAWANTAATNRSKRRHAAALVAVEELYERWERATESRGDPAS